MFLRIITSFVLALGLMAGVAAQERTRDGVTLPVVVKEVKPVYTVEAKEARIQGLFG